jgi:cyclophilin family peptidyl-prolyl cis-trans isomerase
VVELDNGRRFQIMFNRDLAPLAYARFARLARAHYYDGLTFHRIVPNFVIQGGSPGANEYVGDGPFMRDELGGSHRRGTVGISTRGRDTGDAQIFINLVDNPRLDFEYTVFASVPDAQMEIVDAIQEGTRIVRINFVRSQ